MKFYQHTITKTDLYLMTGTTPQWCNTHVDGSHSRERRTPMYCRLVPSGEVALVHVVEWAYTDYLTEINEEQARKLDEALIDRVARIERGEQVQQFTKRTKGYATLQE